MPSSTSTSLIPVGNSDLFSSDSQIYITTGKPLQVPVVGTQATKAGSTVSYSGNGKSKRIPTIFSRDVVIADVGFGGTAYVNPKTNSYACQDC